MIQKLDIYIGFIILTPVFLDFNPLDVEFWVLTVPHLAVYIFTYIQIERIKEHLRKNPK